MIEKIRYIAISIFIVAGSAFSVLGSDGEYVGGGAYRTEFWVDPKEDITGIILVQLREPQYNLRFHDTIKTLIYQALR